MSGHAYGYNPNDYYPSSPPPPALPPRPHPAQAPPPPHQYNNQQDGQYYHLAPPPVSQASRPGGIGPSPSSSWSSVPGDQRNRHSLPPPPPPPPPHHSAAVGNGYPQQYPEKGFSETSPRRRWLPRTAMGKCLLWSLIAAVLIVVIVVVAVAVTLSRRDSGGSGSGNANGNPGPAPTEPDVDRVPSDYSENHPLSPSQGGVNTSGEFPNYGNRSIDHFVIHFNRTTVLTRLDPIVSPGNVSQHAHRFLGASYIKPELAFRDELVRESECSTVPVQDDKSQYWMPQIYHRFSNGSYLAVPVRQASVYYFQKAPSKDKIYPYPDNYNIVVGNPNRRFASANDSGAVRYNCYRGNGNDIASNGFPNSECPDGLIQILTFPSCWDGVYADDAKYMSHVTFPTDGPNGFRCPRGFPYKFITLQYEMIFDVGRLPYNGNGTTWILANGDTTGYGIHGDFVNGWHPATIQALTEVCRYMNATTQYPTRQEPRNCPALNRTYNAARAANCRLQTQIIDEDVGMAAPIARLPGCNDPWTGNTTRPGCSGGRTEGGPPNLVNPRTWFRNEPIV